MDTVILYDIENLIGGYSNDQLIRSLSLKGILKTILEEDLVNRVCIQKAYADWSNHRLRRLRHELSALGIEPVQMFGFGTGPSKNASDIQIAADAIEIALTKSHINTFVIVSGDGGFSYVANKLHSYGKRVIGCAYKQVTNDVFKAVADQFIWIANNELTHTSNKEEQDLKAVAENTAAPKVVVKARPGAIVQAYKNTYNAIKRPPIPEQEEEIRSVIAFIEQNETAQTYLSSEGLVISIINELLRYRLKGFDYKLIQRSNFTSFLARFLEGTTMTLAKNRHNNNIDYKLLYRASCNEEDWEAVTYSTSDAEEQSENIGTEPVVEQDVTVTAYRNFLKSSIPGYQQFSQLTLEKTIEYLSANKSVLQDREYRYFVVLLKSRFDTLSTKQIHDTLSSLISAGCLVSYSSNLMYREKEYSLAMRDGDNLYQKVVYKMRKAIENEFGAIDENIFRLVMD